MGLLSYLKPGKNDKKASPEVTPAPSAIPTTPTSGISTPVSGSSPWSTEVRWNIMADYLRMQQLSHYWSDGPDQGVVMKKSRNNYICSPPELVEIEDGFMKMITMLNVQVECPSPSSLCPLPQVLISLQVAMTINTPVIKRFVGCEHISLPNGLHLQVLPDLVSLPSCQKNQSAAFITDRAQIIVWDDDPNLIMKRAAGLVEGLLQIVWSGDVPDANITYADEKKFNVEVNVSEVQSDDSNVDVEAAGVAEPAKRRKIFFAYPIISGLAIMLSIGSMGDSWGNIAREVSLDGNYIRCLLALMFPFVAWASLVSSFHPHLSFLC